MLLFVIKFLFIVVVFIKVFILCISAHNVQVVVVWVLVHLAVTEQTVGQVNLRSCTRLYALGCPKLTFDVSRKTRYIYNLQLKATSGKDFIATDR